MINKNLYCILIKEIIEFIQLLLSFIRFQHHIYLEYASIVTKYRVAF